MRWVFYNVAVVGAAGHIRSVDQTATLSGFKDGGNHKRCRKVGTEDTFLMATTLRG
jgi:hypothetical protein